MNMIDYSRAFHTGVLTPDLDEAIEFYSRTLGMTFAEPYEFDSLPFWTPSGGLTHIRDRFTYSIEGPLHLELQAGEKGSFYDPALSRGDHVGIWVDDVHKSVSALLTEGWILVGAGAAPEDGYGLFAYLEPASGGMRVELVSDTLVEPFQRWFRGEGLHV
jgi:catechol 2,3-dioxygenase-like lactoylglutathione lyase family enzyme